MGVAGGAGALFDLDVVFLEVFLELLLVVLVCVDGLSVVLQDGGVVAQLCRADGCVLDAKVEGETHDVDLCGVVFLQVLVELSLVPLPGVVERTVVLAIGQVPLSTILMCFELTSSRMSGASWAPLVFWTQCTGHRVAGCVESSPGRGDLYVVSV